MEVSIRMSVNYCAKQTEQKPFFKMNKSKIATFTGVNSQ